MQEKVRSGTPMCLCRLAVLTETGIGTSIGSMGQGFSWNFRRACSCGYVSRMAEEILSALPCPCLTTKNLLGPAPSRERLGLQLSASWPALWLSHSCIPNSKRDASCYLLPKRDFRTLPCPTIPSSRLLISCTWGVSTYEVFAWCLLLMS